jgi:hypothetical protein
VSKGSEDEFSETSKFEKERFIKEQILGKN